MRTLKAALIGCGQIADAHLGELRRLPGVNLVATCDVHRDLAAQAAARFGVSAAFDSIAEMLASAKPDVVHITTPPHSHKELACAALAAGAHVYVEKPFAVDPSEAAAMLDASDVHQRAICVGHDQLFDPIWLECRRRSATGEFGDIVHIDSVLGYDLAGPFGAQLTEDRSHWVHRLPGGLFQNNISHALYRITEFMTDAHPRIRAHWFSSAPHIEFPTDLRVMLEGERMTASIVFSSRARPVQRVARLYGTRAVAEVNLDSRTLRVERPSRALGPFIKLHLSWAQLAEARRGFRGNVRCLLRSELQFFGGMRRLFELFYASIRDGAAPPIAPSEILRVTAIIDDIFRACVEDEREHLRPQAANALSRLVVGGAV
jgi:predicted dehydrogenase